MRIEEGREESREARRVGKGGESGVPMNGRGSRES